MAGLAFELSGFQQSLEARGFRRKRHSGVNSAKKLPPVPRARRHSPNRAATSLPERNGGFLGHWVNPCRWFT
eukprot:3732403-Pyramimonas_sp.AAC.1